MLRLEDKQTEKGVRGGAGAVGEATKPLPLTLTLLSMWEYFTLLHSGFVNRASEA